MMNVELRGDGADFPVLAEIEAANLGVLLGRDHRGASPETRDGPARAVEGARRCPGHRPCIATPPRAGRPAPRPSSCPRGVSRVRAGPGKGDPSRERGTRAGGRDDRGGLRDCADGVGGPHGQRRDAPRCDTPASNRRGRDHTTCRSRKGGCSAGRFSGEAACPRRRSGGALRLDTAPKPWHKRADWLGRVGASRRSPRVWRISSRPSPHSLQAQLTPPPRARLSRGSGPCSCHRQMASRA